MFFLIEYNRKQGRIVAFETFDDADRLKAQDAQLELELKLHRLGIDHEIVILEAESEAAIRRTHRRYFEDLAQLATLPEPAIAP